MPEMKNIVLTESAPNLDATVRVRMTSAAAVRTSLDESGWEAILVTVSRARARISVVVDDSVSSFC
jgi:hypothetical protein